MGSSCMIVDQWKYSGGSHLVRVLEDVVTQHRLSFVIIHLTTNTTSSSHSSSSQMILKDRHTYANTYLGT